MGDAEGGTVRMPALFIPHGGGPCFFMEDPQGVWEVMAAFLRGIPEMLPARPRAVLVVSGHWEEPRATVNVAERPPLLFDYHGFPEHTYRLSWPAPGAPELAARVRALLAGAGIPSGEEAERGFDHGVFVPFLLIDPAAETPTLQLSLLQGLDPAAHLALGRALAPLRDEGVLIVGSGMSFHNLAAFRTDDPRTIAAAEAFDLWLAAAAGLPDPERRAGALRDWAAAPGARACHPREEHLLPLMVAAGAAGADGGRQAFRDRIFGKPVSGFVFGG